MNIILVLLTGGALAILVWLAPGLRQSPTVWGLVLSGIFGAATGASEIISRYRDEPLRATVNKYGLSYLIANALLSVAAFGLLARYAAQILPAASGDWLLRSIIAGFGAMAIVRSKFFIFRSEDGKEYPIGPAIVIETFLQMLDRKIDRYRASRRQKRVSDKMTAIRNFQAAADYLNASLLSFQNLSQQEKTVIASVVNQYKQSQWPAELQVMAIGFAFLTIAGEENFDQVIDNLNSYLKTLQVSAPAPAPALTTPPAP